MTSNKAAERKKCIMVEENESSGVWRLASGAAVDDDVLIF
jgi:hypothetical protein